MPREVRLFDEMRIWDRRPREGRTLAAWRRLILAHVAGVRIAR
jgi:hypothetical protein